ncbi:hypothetical protein EDD22DRAFT_303075 [Suillus occidentalis]|nr:hypothetical protein EDD22DRAFT_303075 [Suillus occidentalis]
MWYWWLCESMHDYHLIGTQYVHKFPLCTYNFFSQFQFDLVNNRGNHINHIFVRRPTNPKRMMGQIPTLYHGFLSDLFGVMPQDGPCSIRVIEGAVTPRACPARPKRNFSIYYTRLQREHPKIVLEMSCRHRDRQRGSRFWRYKRWTMVYLARTL